MLSVKSLKIAAVLDPAQLKPTDATSVTLKVTTPEGATASAVVSGSVLHGGGMSLSPPYPGQGFMRRGRNAGVPGPSFGSGH